MRGTSRRLKLPFILERSAETGDGNKQLRLKAETRIDRHDYGVGSKKMTDKLVGRMVTLSLDIVATSRHAADTTDVSAKP